ncbi:unnamed protein product [Owenia fusiformis]|uniref:Uncharacterized protein n=1 Tax=Owenia fusiformis TaxID=6347 RepID=A0A8S4Q2V5_OWEFU|nr:unnamed protein product [Owenia fusiformis]
MMLTYQRVEPECPDFAGVYQSREHDVILKGTNLSVVFDRNAVLYLKGFVEQLLARIQPPITETAIPAVPPEEDKASQQPSIFSTMMETATERPEPGGTKVNVATSFDELAIKLCNDETRFAEIHIKGMEGKVQVKYTRTILQGRLKDITIDDSRSEYYPKILAIEDNSVFDLKVVINNTSPQPPGDNKNKPRERDSNKKLGIDASVKLRIGRIYVVYLNKFIMDIVDYAEPFYNPEYTQSATKAARQAVARQVQEIQTRGMCVSLNLDVKAPTVLVPQNSKSANIILLKLGDLSLKNYFEQSKMLKGNQSYDHIYMHLDYVEITRAVLSMGGKVEPVHTIVEPIRMRVDVKRAIKPVIVETGIDISGSLQEIKVNLTQQDLKIVMATLRENLSDGSPQLKPESNEVFLPDIAEETEESTDATVSPRVNTEPGGQTKVSFIMDGMILTLKTDVKQGDLMIMSPGSGNTSDGLSRFEIGRIDMSVFMNPDTSMEVGIRLQSLAMDDIRPDSQLAIKRILQSHLDLAHPQQKKADLPPMVDFTYLQDPNGNMNVALNMERMRVNVCIKYFMTIIQLFTGAFEDATPAPTPEPPAPIPRIRESRRLSARDSMRRSMRGSMWVDPVQLEEKQATLRIRGEIKHPEIVLFANPSEKHSRVLVMKTNIVYDYEQIGEKMRVTGSMADLQIISGVYGKKQEISYKVLLPCNIEVEKAFASEKSGLNIDAKLSKINLHLSVTTVNIILGVIEAINAPVQPVVEKEESTKEKTDDTNLWNVVPVTQDKWLTKQDPPRKASTFPSPAENLSLETLTLSAPEVIVMYESEARNWHVPMLCLQTSLQGDLHDWSRQMWLQAELHLQMSFFNEKLAMWEPLIEPVMEYEDHYRPWEMLFKMIQAESHPITSEVAQPKFQARDEVDSHVHKLMCRASTRRSTRVPPIPETETETTETETENEMTIVRPLSRRKKLSSRFRRKKKADIVDDKDESETESENENVDKGLLDKLGHLFTSDSSEDADVSDQEDEVSIPQTSPVFLHKSREAQDSVSSEVDVVDGGALDTEPSGGEVSPVEPVDMCTYLVVDSRDMLLLNLTPQAMDILLDVSQTFSSGPKELSKSVLDLPMFEMTSHLGIGCKANLTLHRSIKAGKEHLHNLTRVDKPDFDDEVDGGLKVKDTDSDEDEVDGLGFIARALAGVGHTAISAGAFISPDDDINPHGTHTEVQPDTMHLEIDGFSDLYNLSHRKAVKHLIPLSPEKNLTRYVVMLEVDVKHGKKQVTIRSPLQLYNHLTIPVDVYCLTEHLKVRLGDEVPSGEEKMHLATLEPGQSFPVPLYAAYHCRLFIAPTEKGYQQSYNGLWWADLCDATGKDKYFHCLSLEGEKKPFHFKVECMPGETSKKSTLGLPKAMTIPHYDIHLYPPVRLHNYLPYDVQYSDQVTEGLEAASINQGENVSLHTVDLHKGEQLNIKVLDYMRLEWSGTLDIAADSSDKKTIQMNISDPEIEAKNKQLNLEVSIKRDVTLDVFIYSPYWIINKTELPVQIRGSTSDIIYESCGSCEPVLFGFSKSKKKAKLKAYNSKWSKTCFSLDTVGSSGVVICTDSERNRRYHMLVQIQMSKLKLTKLVTIMPYFLVVNQTTHRLRYMEETMDTELWLDIGPGECTPFWPVSEAMRMFVKHEDSNVTSQVFVINQPHNTVLRMDKGTGLVVEVDGGTESAMTVTFQHYDPGDAPVRVENLCDDIFIKLHQKSQSQVTLLSPRQAVLYTWDDPTTERTLFWNIYNRKKPSYPAFINKDGHGEVAMSITTVRRSSIIDTSTGSTTMLDSSPDDDSELETTALVNSNGAASQTKTDKVIIYWVSYLDGLQRVLLLTQDERVATKARQNNDSEPSQQAMFVSLGGVGVSIVNSLYMEVAYMSLSSGASTWHVQVKDKWKLLSLEDACWLEDKWRNDVTGDITLDDKRQANVGQMKMMKPYAGCLRRTHRPAIWFQYRTSEHHTNLNIKIHRLQIDNQLPDAYFSSVLYPSPTPKYIAKREGTKPFIELAVMRRHVPENNVDTFKYIKLLVQEFNIKLDKGFMLSLYDVAALLWAEEAESAMLQADLTVVKRSLKDVADVQGSIRPQKMFFEYLHFSPLKMRISFSLGGTVYKTQPTEPSIKSDIVDFFLNSVGVTLTEIRQVEIRLAFFERRGVSMSYNQVTSAIQSHYTSQFIQQAYVLILGLDVLGNPYGLIKDFTKGLGDFFYEPFMGSTQGVDEMGEGLIRGVQSLLGHTVGGAAGSVSLIFGSVGRGLAALSFDEDYKRKRRLRMTQQPRHLPESLYLAGKGFVMGVGLGVSGIVVQPLRGAQEEGAEGFFKGVGKGLLGLITKPTGGAADMVSMTFDGIRRAAEMGEDVVVRLRLPRHIHPCLGLKPYSIYQAIGKQIYFTATKNKYSDTYWAHAPLSLEERADVVIVTDGRVILLERCRFWGDWDIEYEVLLDDIVATPAIVDNKLVFKVKKEDSMLNLFSSSQKEIKGEPPDVLLCVLYKPEGKCAMFR